MASTEQTVSARQAEERLGAVFAALADPHRRRIVELLREAGELKVGNIAEAFVISLNGVSKHLKVLEKAGVLRRRVEGREHWLSVEWSALALAAEWLAAHRHFWGRRLDALVDAVSDESEGGEGE